MNYNLNQILPQEYPFRMIDSIISFEKGKCLIARKSITGNEWQQDGFNFSLNRNENSKDTYIFPESLIIESAAQTTIAYFVLTQEASYPPNDRFLLGGIKAEFFKTVSIGDKLTLTTGSYKILGTTGFMDVGVESGTEKIAEIRVFFSIKISQE